MTATRITVRAAEAAEVDHLAKVWYDGWQDAHARILPAELTRILWLACAVGNERAARFYEKCGWRRAGTVVYQPDAANGAPALEVWRYENRLR